MVVGATICGTACAHIDRAALATSTATLACDWGSTRQAAGTGWRLTYEDNPILGLEPSVRAVDGYFAAMIAAQLLAWYLVPRPWRIAGAVALTAFETYYVIDNMPNTGLCGL